MIWKIIYSMNCNSMNKTLRLTLACQKLRRLQQNLILDKRLRQALAVSGHCKLLSNRSSVPAPFHIIWRKRYMRSYFWFIFQEIIVFDFEVCLHQIFFLFIQINQSNHFSIPFEWFRLIMALDELVNLQKRRWNLSFCWKQYDFRRLKECGR